MRRVVVSFVLAGASVASAFAQVAVQPTLGADASAFEAVLGGPNDASVGPLIHLQRCAGTDIDQFVLLAPNDQVWTIQRSYCDLGTKGAEERFQDAQQFLPADAVQSDTFTTDMAEAERTFESASLAAALPAGLFHDCTGNGVPPGTLFVVADSFGGWYMGPGTCPGG